MCAIKRGLGYLTGAGPTANVAAETERLAGHSITIAADGAYTINSIAGEGKPLVGEVERRGKQLWLQTEQGPSYRLTGRLAKARIAGPRYKVWVIGSIKDDALRARRLGVLRPPRNR